MCLYKIKQTSPLLLFFLTLLLTLLLFLPWVSAKEPPKPQPTAWQINGIVAALDDGHDGVKKLAFEKLNEYDLQNLQSVVDISKIVLFCDKRTLKRYFDTEA
ncbi:hypothetical protein [Nostoc sp. UHCC 0870]|uniref:hypothetical protein n=1 Tax=Nostoc sp. UHCC 0870 TaxID=2914041 RepID=UPI001EE14F39|nr:hypothetical protein [Nostoc sp. UHCC 0870]UKO99405.1 hypothetical protein L6494_06760 [Nostoc sp. UHCC 0870]